MILNELVWSFSNKSFGRISQWNISLSPQNFLDVLYLDISLQIVKKQNINEWI